MLFLRFLHTIFVWSSFVFRYIQYVSVCLSDSFVLCLCVEKKNLNVIHIVRASMRVNVPYTSYHTYECNHLTSHNMNIMSSKHNWTTKNRTNEAVFTIYTHRYVWMNTEKKRAESWVFFNSSDVNLFFSIALFFFFRPSVFAMPSILFFHYAFIAVDRKLFY